MNCDMFPVGRSSSFDVGTGEQISPNSDVISSIVNAFSSEPLEFDRRATTSTYASDASDGGRTDNSVGQRTGDWSVERIRWMFSGSMMSGRTEDEGSSLSIIESEHEQWASDVTVLIRVKRRGM